MIRTQIQLTEEQAVALKKLAAAENRSMADLIRESVETYMASGPPEEAGPAREEALELIGRYRSGMADLAKEHDRYLSEDLAR